MTRDQLTGPRSSRFDVEQYPDVWPPWCGITSRRSTSLIRDNRRSTPEARLYNNRYHLRGSPLNQPSPCSTTIRDSLWGLTTVRCTFSFDLFHRNWVMTTVERSCLVSDVWTSRLGRGPQDNKGLGRIGKI